jgi:hypothetical protein
MNTLLRYSNSNKATICEGKNCVTVYGDVASTIQQIALLVAIFVAASTIAKAIR